MTKYEIILYWSEEDGAYIAEVPELAGCMAEEGISLAQVIQKSDEGSGVPLVFMTHETTEEAMSRALQPFSDLLGRDPRYAQRRFEHPEATTRSNNRLQSYQSR